MKLPKPVRKLVNYVTEKRQSIKQRTEQEELVQDWKDQFEVDRKAKSEWDDRFVEWEGIYNGDREFGNLSTEANKDRTMRTNINFPRMIVERLIDPNYPQPDFKAVAADDEEAVDTLKNYVAYVVRAAEPSLEEINLIDERRVKKFGGTFRKVHWDNNIKRAGNVGDITVSNPHPKDIIPNKGATTLQDLEHYHHCANHTGKYITRKWPHISIDDLEDKAVYYDDLDNLDSDNVPFPSTNDFNSFEARETGLKKYTIIETTYRDEDGDICKLWWSGDLFIKQTEKFYWRRDEQGKPTKTEVLEAGSKVRKTQPDGTSKLITLEKPTEVEYYIPTRWDLTYEPYIPRDKCFWGVSLMEDIHDLNEAIKKAVFQAEERRLRGNKKILVDSENDKMKILDPRSEVVVIQGTYHGTVDLGAPDDIAWLEKLKEWLQLITGATNAAMGVEMPSVTSGKQAQTYIEQANKKIGNSSAYKAASYKALYRIVADFALAFADGDRPFRLTGDKDKAEYGSFNRLNMLKDKSGNLFYPDYDVEIGADGGFLQQKGQIMQVILDLANGGKFEVSPGNLRILKILKKIGVPYLEDIIDNMQEELDKAEQQAKMQAQQQQATAAQPQPQQGAITPQMVETFKQLPADVRNIISAMDEQQQAEILSQSPEKLAQIVQQIQAQQGGQGTQGQPQGGMDTQQAQQLILQLPPDQQAQVMQMLQQEPEKAMAMFQQALGQMGGTAQ